MMQHRWTTVCFLLLASVAKTAMATQQHSAQAETEHERKMHVDENYPNHWHLENITDYYEDYYIHFPEDWSFSMPTRPPVPHYNYYYVYKGKGMSKSKKGKKHMKSKSMKSKSHKKKSSSSHGYWYEYEHYPHKGKGLAVPKRGEEGYWYYYEHEHEHEHEYGDKLPHWSGHGHGHEYENYEPEYYYYYYYYYYDDEEYGHKSKKSHKSKKGHKEKGYVKGYPNGKGFYPPHYPKDKNGGGGGGGLPPRPRPRPNNMPTVAPTRKPTAMPNTAPPTVSPTEKGDSVVVEPFTLTYTFSVTGTASLTMLSELTVLTAMFLDEFLRTNYAGSAVRFERADTDRRNYFALLGRVDYNSTLHFFPGAVIPSTPELNNAIEVAFSGNPLQRYIDLVKELPLPNVFRSITGVQFQRTAEVTSQMETQAPVSAPVTPAGGIETVIPPLPTYNTPQGSTRSGSSGSSSDAAIVAAAGAGAFVLVVAGFLLYRRSTEEVELAGKFIDPDANMTLTVAGDTYVGGQSTDSHTDNGESRAGTPLDQKAYRSETPDWKEYHDKDRQMMSEEEWNQYQEGVANERSESPFEAIPEERPLSVAASSDDGDSCESEQNEKDIKLPYGEDDDSFPERILSELDDVTL